MRILTPAAVALVLVLAGCTPAPVTPAPVPSTTTAPTIVNPDVVPLVLGAVSAENAAAEGNRLGDALEALVDPASIVNVSDASQLAPAEDDVAPYYVVYRTYTLDPAVDPLALAQTITAILRASNWTVYEETNEGGLYLAPLSSGSPEESWFALIGGDASVVGQSVVTFQIASPDLTA